MKMNVLTLFPEVIKNSFETSITGKAVENRIIDLEITNIRDYTTDKHNKVDDYTYGGGAGMLMQAQPVYDAFKSIELNDDAKVIYMTPVGKVFNQSYAKELSASSQLVFICGHYEGIDERVLDAIVTDRISIGDYVLTGGELPALVVMDTVSRLIKGVLGNEESAMTESFDDFLLEYPQYSRPEVWNDVKVPEVLLSGNHKLIEEWRLNESLRLTKEYRPDLYELWASSHPEYFEMIERKTKKLAEKERKRLKKLALDNKM